MFTVTNFQLTNGLRVKAIFTHMTQHFLQECTQVQEHIFSMLWQLHNNLKHRMNNKFKHYQWYTILIYF